MLAMVIGTLSNVSFETEDIERFHLAAVSATPIYQPQKHGSNRLTSGGIRLTKHDGCNSNTYQDNPFKVQI